MGRRLLSLKALCSIITEPILIGKDSVTVLTGAEGEGKSMFAMAIAKEIDSNFSVWNSIVYTGFFKEYAEKYARLHTNGVFILDEAIELMYTMDFMKSDSKALVKSFAARQRKEKQAAYILNIPYMKDLNTYWRERRSRLWIEMLPREYFSKNGKAAAVVFEKPHNPFSPTAADPWLMKDSHKDWTHMIYKKGYNPVSAIELMRGHPYYIGEILVDQVSKKLYDTYLEAREFAYKNYEESKPLGVIEKKHYEWCSKMIRILSKEKNMGDAEIATKTGMSEKTVYRMRKKAEDMLKTTT